MAMLYQLHNQRPDQFVYTCNNCKSNVETRWHCTVCDDFDLCVKCYTKDGHIHKMQKLGFELGDDSTGGDKNQINPQESRNKLTIQRCILSLEHACQCRDANCRLPSCQKMKRIVSHAKTCKRKGNGSCAICKQLIALNCYHAKNCQENKCPVPFCLNIKYKLKQQRMAQQQILKRRIATIQNRMTEAMRQSSPGSSSQPKSDNANKNRPGMPPNMPPGMPPMPNMMSGMPPMPNMMSGMPPGMPPMPNMMPGMPRGMGSRPPLPNIMPGLPHGMGSWPPMLGHMGPIGHMPKEGATNAKEETNEKIVEETKVENKVDFECKICMDEQVGVVFLPCGHLASCAKCAQRLSNCPMCRKQITGKVRTYLS